MSKSAQDRRKEVRAWIRAGQIILVQNDFAPTDKFVIVASADPDLLCFVINSEINAFIQKQPRLLECQVLLKESEHKHFLKKDSHADCSKAINAVPMIKAVSQLVADGSRMKGHVTDAERQAIIQAVNNAHTISPALKQRILKEWGAA